MATGWDTDSETVVLLPPTRPRGSLSTCPWPTWTSFLAVSCFTRESARTVLL